MLIKTNRRFRIFSSAATFLILAIGSGCTGFFVNPTLLTVTVGPTGQTILQGSTLQMVANGTYDSGGAVKPLSGNVFWSSSDSTIARVNSTGLVTAVSPGQVTITAQSGTVSGSTTVTVALANITSIVVTPTNTTITMGSTKQYTAMATLSDGTVHDISTSAVWASSNTSAGTIDNKGLFTAVTSVTGNQATTITATEGSITGSAALTVTP